MSRPVGAPFWGESIGAWDWFSQSPGVDPYPDVNVWDLRLGIGAGPAPVLSAGESISAGCYETKYLQADDVALISWVVTLGAGTAATVRVSSGLNPGWDEDTAPLTEDLGVHSVAGAMEMVLPTSSITVADIVAASALPQCLVECLSGSIVLHQIKLRVWPPGGPVGGWSGVNLPPKTVDRYPHPFPFHLVEATGSASGFPLTDPGHEAAWNAATDDLRSAVAYPSPPLPAIPGLGPSGSPSGTLAEYQATADAVVSSGGGEDAFADAHYATTGVWIGAPPTLLIGDFYAGRTAGLVDGVDYIYPPDMVAPYRRDGVGAWVHAYAQVTSDRSDGASAGLHDTSVVIASASSDYSALTIDYSVFPAEYRLALSLPSGGVTVPKPADPDVLVLAAGDIPLPSSSDAIVVTIRHSIESSGPDYLGYGSALGGPVAWGDTYVATMGQGDPTDSANFQRIAYRVTFPPAQLWVPSPGATPYLWNVRSDGLGRNNLWNLPNTRQSTLWNDARQ